MARDVPDNLVARVAELEAVVARLESGVAEELGDDDEVGPASHEGGGEGVPEDMRGGVVVEAGAGGDAGDDGVGPSDAEAPALLVEEDRRALGGAGPVGAFGEPAGEGAAELGVDGDLSDPFAFAVDPQDAFAGGEVDVVDVEGDDLGDAGAGVERQEGQGLVSGGRAGLDGSQEPDLGPLVEGSGGGVGDLDAGGFGGAEASAGVEVVDRGEGVVDRGRFWPWPPLGGGFGSRARPSPGRRCCRGGRRRRRRSRARPGTGGPWRYRCAVSGRRAGQSPGRRRRCSARPRRARPARQGRARAGPVGGRSCSLKQVPGLVVPPGACSLKPRREGYFREGVFSEAVGPACLMRLIW